MVTQMEALNVAKRDESSKAAPPQWGNKLAYAVGIVVTFDVFLQVLMRWPHFDFLSRCVATMLCVLLVGMPSASIWRERRGRPTSRTEVAFAGYIALGLAVGLINR
jgi:hypothetical protein